MSGCKHSINILQASHDGALHCRCGQTFHSNKATALLLSIARDEIANLNAAVDRIQNALSRHLGLVACAICGIICEQKNPTEGLHLRSVGEYNCIQCVGKLATAKRYHKDASADEIASHNEEIINWYATLPLPDNHYLHSEVARLQSSH